MEVLRSKLLSEFPQVVFGMSTRDGGVSPPPYNLNLSLSVGDKPDNVHQNRRLFFRALEIDSSRLAFPLQVHSSNIRIADKPGQYPDTDGLATDQAFIYIIITVADCLPVFLYDPLHNVIAGVHAGWKGSSLNIIGKMIGLMKEQWKTNPADLIVYCGPSAAVCCYEVGEEVALQFSPEFIIPQSNGKYRLDLPEVNKSQLLSEGIRSEHIDHENLCTICNADRFHSYRRDGKRSGRMMGVIGLKRIE